MCKFCERIHKETYYAWSGHYGAIKENNLLMAAQPYTGIEIQNTKKDGFSIIATGDFSAVYYPKFCPECGRKLLDNEQINKKKEYLMKEFSGWREKK